MRRTAHPGASAAADLGRRRWAPYPVIDGTCCLRWLTCDCVGPSLDARITARQASTGAVTPGFTATPGPIVEETVIDRTYVPLAAAGLLR